MVFSMGQGQIVIKNIEGSKVTKLNSGTRRINIEGQRL